MRLTRRSLLQTLSALPAAWCLRGLPASGQQCTTNPPSPNSAFVLLEGPWLIFPDSANKARLIGLSLDDSLDTGGIEHYCVLEGWNCGQHPQARGVLDSGTSLTVVSNSDAADFFTVFDAAFQQFPFIWAKTDTTAKVQGKERFVSLPVPSQVHIAGLLKNSVVSGSGYRQPSQQGQTVLPHVVTILEYKPPAAGGIISLTLSGVLTAKLGPADQLVVTMFHSSPLGDSDLPHMQDSFSFLRNHLTDGGSGIQVQYKDAKFDPGDADGFSNDELGLDPQANQLARALKKVAPQKFQQQSKRTGQSDSYSNCCGGGIVSGPG